MLEVDRATLEGHFVVQGRLRVGQDLTRATDPRRSVRLQSEPPSLGEDENLPDDDR